MTSRRSERTSSALSAAPPAERAGFGITLSFSITLFTSRLVAHMAERRRSTPTLRSVVRRVATKPLSDSSRVHHFVPGIGLLLATGAAAIIARDDGRELLLSIPFGTGAALTLDELGLLLERRNPYWGTENLALAQGSAAAFAAAALGARMRARRLRR